MNAVTHHGIVCLQVTPSWYDNVLLKSEGDQLWIKNFRLPKAAIDNICKDIETDMAPEALCIRDAIPIEKRVCIALYKLASCCEYRSVAKVFGVSVTSVHRCLYRFCSAMSRRKHNYIRWYTTEDATALAELTRERYGYPQAIGAIDGSHIPITPPADGYADYICRKQYPSIVLQAVADVHFKFRDTYANTPGSAHDAAVFHRSPLSDMLSNTMPKRDIELSGVAIPLHLLGDPAYPISTFIMKGYVGRNLTPAQESFNVYHSSARMCVEIAFGRLKSRWRVLKKRLDISHTFAPQLITTCCILHNICEDYRAPVPPESAEQTTCTFQQPPHRNDTTTDTEASNVRAALTNHLAENFPLRRSFHNM